MLNPFSIKHAFGCYFNPIHMNYIPAHTSVGLVWEVNPKYQSFVHTHHTLKQVCEGVWTCRHYSSGWKGAQFPSYSGFVDIHKLCREPLIGIWHFGPQMHMPCLSPMWHHWDPVCVRGPASKLHQCQHLRPNELASGRGANTMGDGDSTLRERWIPKKIVWAAKQPFYHWTFSLWQYTQLPAV